MKKFHNKLWLFIISLVVIGFVIKCDKSPTEPEESIPWSKITGKIAYVRWDGDWHYLYILDGTAKEIKLVKKSKEDHFDNLTWYPDGTKLIFVGFFKTSSNQYFYQLCSINADGSNRSIIYATDAHNDFPAISTDGRVAYWYSGASYPPHLHEVWINNSPFFDKAVCDMTRPAWSPDGQFIIISLRDSTSQGALYKVSLSDTSFAPLLQGSGYANLVSKELFHDPIYSPDGNKIAFTKHYPSSNNDNSEIWTINSDGSNPIQLTIGFEDWYPAWSPDGERIAFTRGHAINSRIFIMNADGSDVTQVTQNEGQYPAWIQ